jgi:hypothetical protein
MMLKFVTTAVLSALFLCAPTAKAEGSPKCPHNDVAMGPNCVAVRIVAPEDGDKAVSAIMMSRVYRVASDGTETVVWSGLGDVLSGDKDKLHVQIWFVVRALQPGVPRPDVKIEFDVFWDGKKYDDVRITENEPKKAKASK